MATASTIVPAQRTASAFPIYWKETKYEFLKLLRTRSFSLSVIGFPVMFYVLFGVANKHAYEGSVSIAKLMLGGYACFGMVGAALFGVGVGLAFERSQGWLELKRASPMPPMAYLLAKCLTAIAFGLIIVTILIAIGTLFASVTLTPVEVAKMLGITVAGSTVFASMGLLLALIVPANAAPGVVNLIYLPMSFASGLWIPLQFLPHFVQKIAPFLPTYHLSQLMLSVFGYRDQMSLATHWSGLAGFVFVMLGASWAVFHRMEND
ncbi:ABC transporter permease [Granulicella arctica]|uniref:ABC transporter permease n=1 Tax=Granulicella arctica TaxID=940613 RepID=UPI0021E06F59|nr:ABC transporter permease [Granulicella arctica]